MCLLCDCYVIHRTLQVQMTSSWYVCFELLLAAGTGLESTDARLFSFVGAGLAFLLLLVEMFLVAKYAVQTRILVTARRRGAIHDTPSTVSSSNTNDGTARGGGMTARGGGMTARGGGMTARGGAMTARAFDLISHTVTHRLDRIAQGTQAQWPRGGRAAPGPAVCVLLCVLRVNSREWCAASIYARALL